jgi:putative peptidoglycan binding protein
MTLARVSIPSPNYSSRGGATVRLIVLHTAEGSRTIESLGNFFASSSSGVSSHAGADDKPNTIGEYVARSNKAWTQANANPVAVSLELCAFAAWTPAEWNAHPNMLANCAAWIAEEAAAFGIPLVKLTPQQAQSNGRGVCQHVDLGSWGGGHTDCGPNFPMDSVISMAGGSKPAPSPPSPPSSVPPLHVDYFGRSHNSTCPDVRTWQNQMSARGWTIGVDGIYGPQSESVCRSFQSEKGLSVDGLVGPNTWAATWTAPVT